MVHRHGRTRNGALTLALLDGSSRWEEGMLSLEGTAQNLETIKDLAIMSIVILVLFWRPLFKLMILAVIATVIVMIVVGAITLFMGVPH
jgi:hypothetical protein